MAGCGGKGGRERVQGGPAAPAGAARPSGQGPLEWFRNMTGNALAYVEAERRRGRHVVGIACEYAPRELILAAGGIPACLCGGAEEMVAPAEEVLPANLCPLVKSTYGYSLRRANPFLELAELVVVETTCDAKKKMYELLARDRPLHVLELPQKPGSPGALDLWEAEIRGLEAALAQRFKTRITATKLREAIALMNRERRLRRELAALMRDPAPPLTGRELLDLKSIVSGIPADLAMYERALRELPGRRLDPPAAERVRVLLTGVPIPHGAERVLDLIEGAGGLVVAQENCTGLKPILEDVPEGAPDPVRALAEKYFHIPCSVMTPNLGRFDSLRRLAGEYRPQCLIELVWHACLTYDVEAHLVRRLAEEELRLPYLKIDTDYSPADAARIAVRVEALFETVRGGARPAPRAAQAPPAAKAPGG